jgi:hypothetical protein
VNGRRFAALCPLPAVFAAGAALAWNWRARAPERIATDLAQPLVVVTAWGSYGAVAFAILGGTILTVALALVIVGRRLAQTARDDDVAAVALVAALCIGAAIAWPFVFSSDPYAYAAYGAMVRDGIDPYAPLGTQVSGPFYDAARWQWGGAYPVCVYGPLFVALAAAVVTALGAHGVAATLLGFRLLAALAFVGSIGFLNIALGGLSRPRRFVALCAYGLNPVILWTVAEGHNDALLLLAATGAAALARARPALGAFVLGLGPLLKAPALAFAFGAALDTWLRGRPERARILAALGAGLGLAALLTLPLMRPALASLDAHGRYAPEISVQGLLGPLWAFALAGLAATTGIVRLWRHDAAGAAWLGIALLLALPNGYPWYALWLVPWCLAAGDGAASRALWAATISAGLRYLPDATGTLGPEAARLVSAVAALPLAFAVADFRPTLLKSGRYGPPIPPKKKAPARS